MKKTIAIILVVLLTNVGFTLAQTSKMNLPKHEGMIKSLNMNETQEKQFNNLHFEHKEKTIDWKAQIKKNRLEIQKMMADSKINESKLKELTNANSDIKAQMHSAKVDMWLNIYNILNDDQKEQWTNHFSRIGKGDRMCRDGAREFRKGMKKGMRNRDLY